MQNSLKEKRVLKNIITSFLIFAVTAIFFIGGAKNIANAAQPVTASFYLVDEAKAAAEYPNVTTDCFKWYGTGKITYTGFIYDDPEATAKVITSAPASTNITWKYVVKLSDGYYVGGVENTTASTATNNQQSTSTDDSENTTISSTVLNSASSGVTHTLTRDEILSATSSSYPSGDSVKWEGFSQIATDVADGVIPVSLLDDPVYTSMNLPSETRSDYMISVNRDNAHTYNNFSNSSGDHLVSIGSIYQTSGKTLSKNMTICLGKIKLFGYNKNTQTWEVIQEDAHIVGASIYTLPWTTSTSYSVPITTYSDHLEVTVTSSDLTNKVLHFWGTRTAFDKTKYSYYATAYTCWSKNTINTNSLTAVNAIDLKSGTKGGTVAQINSSRGYAVTTSAKVIWSTTIPNDVYQASWGEQLQALYEQ